MQYLHIKYSIHYIQLSTGNLKFFQHLLFWLQRKKYLPICWIEFANKTTEAAVNAGENLQKR